MNIFQNYLIFYEEHCIIGQSGIYSFIDRFTYKISRTGQRRRMNEKKIKSN